MTNRLLFAGESKTADEKGRYFGAETFYDDEEGYYVARFHVRIYEGIRVRSAYSTDLVRLEALTPEAAREETRSKFFDFKSLYRREGAES